MVVCASCKQYTDDQKPFCERCGAPLEADTMEEVRATVGLDPLIAQAVADRERAKLVASGVVVRYTAGFLYDDGQRRTVLADLFSALADHQREAAALLFAAVAYLVQEEYCVLRLAADGRTWEWIETRPWDGQALSLEGALARKAGVGRPIHEVVDRLISEEMGFRFEKSRRSPLRIPGTPRRPVRDLSERSATTAVVELGRRTEMPDHREEDACREVYRLLLDFVRADPNRARSLAETITDLLEWFQRYEQDPSLALLR